MLNGKCFLGCFVLLFTPILLRCFLAPAGESANPLRDPLLGKLSLEITQTLGMGLTNGGRKWRKRKIGIGRAQGSKAEGEEEGGRRIDLDELLVHCAGLVVYLGGMGRQMDEGLRRLT
jgi:hypothetical protein